MQVWIALGALAFTVLASIATGGFMMGRLFERVGGIVDRLDDLESEDRGSAGATVAAHATLALAVARLEVGQQHMAVDLAAIKLKLQ